MADEAPDRKHEENQRALARVIDSLQQISAELKEQGEHVAAIDAAMRGDIFGGKLGMITRVEMHGARIGSLEERQHDLIDPNIIKARFDAIEAKQGETEERLDKQEARRWQLLTLAAAGIITGVVGVTVAVFKAGLGTK